MKESEINLLSCLRENSREKLTDISKKSHIPISTLFDMLKELQGEVITKHTVLLNFSKLGYHTQAHIFLRVPIEKRDELKKHLSCHGNVNTLFKMNNGWDFEVETIHHNIRELDNFVDTLKLRYGVTNTEIHYLVDEFVREGFKL